MSSTEQMIISKKQMLIAIGVIFLLIILSVFWIVQSNNAENILSEQNQQQQENQLPEGEEHAPLIKILLIKKTDCENCISLDFLVQTIKTEFDLNILEVKEVDADLEEGKNLIAMHEITKLPSLIITGEFQGTELQELWPNIGEEKNGVLVLRQLEPPFYSIEEDRFVGAVNYILIKKSDCLECEDLTQFSEYIEDLNVFLETKTELEYDSKGFILGVKSLVGTKDGEYEGIPVKNKLSAIRDALALKGIAVDMARTILITDSYGDIDIAKMFVTILLVPEDSSTAQKVSQKLKLADYIVEVDSTLQKKLEEILLEDE